MNKTVYFHAFFREEHRKLTSYGFKKLRIVKQW